MECQNPVDYGEGPQDRLELDFSEASQENIMEPWLHVTIVLGGKK